MIYGLIGKKYKASIVYKVYFINTVCLIKGRQSLGFGSILGNQIKSQIYKNVSTLFHRMLQSIKPEVKKYSMVPDWYVTQ